MLALLDRGPAHGYELKRAHDDLFGDVAPPINVGQIYVTLTRLERDGAVTHRVEGGSGGPDRKVYELTDTGRKSLRGWLDEPSDLPVGKSDVVQRLVAGLIYDATAARAGDPPREGASSTARTLAAHRSRCLRALRALTEAAPAGGGTAAGPAGGGTAAAPAGGGTAAGPTGGGTGGKAHRPAADGLTQPGSGPVDPAVAGVGDLLREASVLHLQAELRWLDLVEARLAQPGRN
jgi:DNA-binding PadR family transcriptional regulator